MGRRPITPEERELVQNFIMKTYDKFLGIVAKERNLQADLLRNTIADGRILSGKDAFEHKLIDGLGELDDAFRKAKRIGQRAGRQSGEIRSAFQSKPLSANIWRIRIKNRTPASEAARSATGKRDARISCRAITHRSGRVRCHPPAC